MRQTSFASPLAVLADIVTLSSPNWQRTGLLSFSLMTTLTRSRLWSIVFVSTTTLMGFLRGMAFL